MSGRLQQGCGRESRISKDVLCQGKKQKKKKFTCDTILLSKNCCTVFFGPQQQHHREYTMKEDVVSGVCFAGADNTARIGERKIRRIDNSLTYYQGHVWHSELDIKCRDICCCCCCSSPVLILFSLCLYMDGVAHNLGLVWRRSHNPHFSKWCLDLVHINVSERCF